VTEPSDSTRQSKARQNISSGTKWEDIAGYSRAVRIDRTIWVAGTTAADENSRLVGAGEPYAQTIYILRKIERALKEAGATLEDVVRTRVYLVRTEDWEQVARAHGEIFGTIRPVNTMLTVKELIGAGYLVEIEADAYLKA
jgi:enamine deaminase RidA (YjgF/YER057c/UK114 family)